MCGGRHVRPTLLISLMISKADDRMGSASYHPAHHSGFQWTASRTSQGSRSVAPTGDFTSRPLPAPDRPTAAPGVIDFEARQQRVDEAPALRFDCPRLPRYVLARAYPSRVGRVGPSRMAIRVGTPPKISPMGP